MDLNQGSLTYGDDDFFWLTADLSVVQDVQRFLDVGQVQASGRLVLVMVFLFDRNRFRMHNMDVAGPVPRISRSIQVL